MRRKVTPARFPLFEEAEDSCFRFFTGFREGQLTLVNIAEVSG